MKVLLTGASGQLGRALLASAPAGIEVAARSRAQLDIADAGALAKAFAQVEPQVVLNAAAYTDVDAAESDPVAASRCNADGVARLAQACARQAARLIHVSTDFVFDGDKSLPYLPQDAPHPVNVYGESKLRGERSALAELGGRACIVRSSWLYGAGSTNFVTRMLELMRTRTELRVVMDQIGAPTWTGSLAPVLWRMAGGELSDIHHWCDSGVASRYDFAVAIAEEAVAAGLLTSLPSIIPITSANYPMPARRPAYAVLDKRSTENALALRAPHWRSSLRHMLRELR